MPVIKFIESTGKEHRVEAQSGQSVMQAATANQVPGILGDCGGSCSCATCHGYVDEEWLNRVPQPETHELDMLTCAADVMPNSRLTCQIPVTVDLDGLVIHLPPTQP
jgi:2Fe-2S ferredoxin